MMAAIWILTGHFAQLGTFLSKEDCRNHSMSSTVCQKYQLILLHAVAFCSEQSTYNLTHNPLCSCTRKRVKDVPMTCTNSAYFVKTAAVRNKRKKKVCDLERSLDERRRKIPKFFLINYTTRYLKMCKTDFIYIEGTESNDVTRSVWGHMFLTVSQTKTSPSPLLFF